MPPVRALAALALVVLAAPLAAQPAPSAYAGMEGRDIKALSPDDIAELRRGGGWGLALSAELNGAPGPAHLLELAEAIPLDPAQIAAIRDLHARMLAEAIPAGERLIALEAALEAGFRARSLDDAALTALLDEIGLARAALRAIHLRTHLRTPELLTPAQIARYAELRGYVAADPCAAVPPGHNPEMWRRHNRCD